MYCKALEYDVNWVLNGKPHSVARLLEQKGPIYNDHISEENCFQMISSPWSMVDINKSVFIIVLPVKNKKNG